MKLKQLPSELLPKSEAMSGASSTAAVTSEDFLGSVLKRWRSATTAHQPDTEDMSTSRSSRMAARHCSLRVRSSQRG